MSEDIVYKPAPIAKKFLMSEKPMCFILGPLGSAKTTAMLFKILYHAKKQAPHPRDGIRYTRWVIIRNTRRQLMDTTLASFFKWFRPGEAGQWVASDDKFIFRFEDVHAEVLFRPLDRPEDIQRVLSLEVTGAAIDEFVQINKDIIMALEGRCGRYPLEANYSATWAGMFGASNPGNEDEWWYDWLYNAWESDVDEEDGGKARKLDFFIQPSGFSPDAENLENLEKIKPNYYRELAKGKSPEWVKQFIEVQWGYSLSGKPVYPVFKAALHVASEPIRYNPHLPLIMGFDAGLTPAATFLQVDPHGRVLVLAELTSDNMGARRFCREKVKPLLAQRFPNASLVIAADPATKQRAQTDEKTVASQLEAELGVRVKPAHSNKLSDRLGCVEELLCRITEVGPMLLVDPSCVRLIQGFKSGYRYETKKKRDADDTHDTPEKKHPVSDVHDSLQYGCMAATRGVLRDARRKERRAAPRFINSYAMR